MTTPINNRYEFVLLFDVENGNPNGDPDAGNMPRIDPETNLGLVTDVCLKRKVRNYVTVAKEGTEGFNIYVEESAILNNQHEKAYKALELKPEAKKLPKDTQKAHELKMWMCQNFFDIRTFGAVMTTEVNCGQVTGPVQINFARSIDKVNPLDITITRKAVSKQSDYDKQIGGGGAQTMGRKFIVPYGLYRVEGYVSAKLAEKTGFGEDDLKLFFDSLVNMFDHDHSAARGKMTARKLFVFKHESALGNAPAHKLFDLIEIDSFGDSAEKPPRSFADYKEKIRVNKADLPEQVEMIELL